MLNRNAKRWVDALRSGRYRQTEGFLHTKQGDAEKFCCLGVACDLFISAGGKLHKMERAEEFGDIENGTVFAYDYEYECLPEVVQNWLGLSGNEGKFIGSTDSKSSLAALNDSGKTFSEIADIIESEPEELFVEKS